MEHYQSEKYGIKIDQGDIVNENINNKNNINNQNDNDESNNNQSKIITTKKNRTIQYYKFLFYSMKLEIKTTEMINLIRFSNISEILLYILSILVVSSYNTMFVILHALHFIRGILGMFLLFKIPQSYHIVRAMESENNRDDMENKIFNDYARKIINIEIFEKSKPLKNLTIAYLVITLINIFIDITDFLNSLSKFNADYEDNIEKITIFVSFIIATLYIGIDFCYIFWFQSLNYSFPQKYLKPIIDSFSGLYDKAKLVFRIGKRETDLNSEEIMNNQNRSNDINNRPKDLEMNPINNNRIDDRNSQNFNNINIPNDHQQNYPNLEDNKTKGYEVNLD